MELFVFSTENIIAYPTHVLHKSAQLLKIIVAFATIKVTAASSDINSDISI